MGEYPEWQVAWFYGHFRAWSTGRPTVVPVEASTEEEMRRRLAARHPAVRRLP
jgi:hypothetical protein